MESIFFFIFCYLFTFHVFHACAQWGRHFWAYRLDSTRLSDGLYVVLRIYKHDLHRFDVLQRRFFLCFTTPFWLKGSSLIRLKCLCATSPQVGRSVLAMASLSGKLSNPWGKMTENQKARTKYGAQSPFTPLLQEDKEKEYADMEREEEQEEEFVPTCPPPMDIPSAKVATEAVTMDGIVTLLQQQLGPITANINALNAGVQLLDAKYRNLRSALENWPKDMETRMDVTQAQVDKMDELLQHLREENSKVEDLIKIRWKPLCET